MPACGFTPAFGPRRSAEGLRNQVHVIAPDTVTGFALRTAIEDQIGRATSPVYTLTLTQREARNVAAVSAVGDTTRFDIRGAVDWVLGSESGGQVGAGTVRTFTSYSATGSTVATQAAEADARNRLARSLADLVVADMILAINE
ncbi:LPS-assembly lipoprotein [Cognatiyoonia koreensis]|uniref:LPS-assembly lipoprotein n=2 Tax=Cognatiyoonia koreensis TaxID=364200 RepID=A0A1I0RUC7_9RHOB|nr:LPS-assembly lipoprotein [Cognatiyoonia koreensis]